MKTYKTWETIKMLTENPNLIFKCVKDATNDLLTNEIEVSANKGGYIDDIAIHGVTFNIKEEWILVQQPVNFMEAIEAYEKGKIVNCQVENKIFKYNPYKANGVKIFGDGGFEITDTNGNTITTIETLRGKWFIEEGENIED